MLLQFIGVSKVFPDGTRALQNVSTRIDSGDFVFLVGASGAGKSTFLKLLFCDEVASRGQVLVAGKNLARLKPREVPILRRNIGIVFQDFRLLANRTVFENVSFAMEVLEYGRKEIRKRVPEILEMVGLNGRQNLYPHQLSGGEQQRTAIARAVINRPRLVIADEPTGNLDRDTSWDIMDLLGTINKQGATVIMATHAWDIVDAMQKRVIVMDHGRIVADGPSDRYAAHEA